MADESPEPEPHIKSFHTVELAGSKSDCFLSASVTFRPPALGTEIIGLASDQIQYLAFFQLLFILFYFIIFLASEILFNQKCATFA